jgi:AcrR family transcriptional regulator
METKADIPRGGDRRREILAAALDRFLKKGFAATSIEDIRRAGGASVGSIYHFFGSKEGIAVALYADAFCGWTEAMLDLSPAGTAPERIVRVTVARALEWAVANPRPYRFLMQARWLEPVALDRADLAAAAAAYRRRGSAVLALLVAGGAVRPLPWDLFQAVLLGPVHDYLAHRASGEAQTDPAQAAHALGDAAWAALRA